MDHSREHESGAGRARHDPLQRLNQHHSAQLLAVARAFGGQPDALFARATAIDDEGIRLVIESASGSRTVEVEFAITASGARRRLALRELARRAAELLDSHRRVETGRYDGISTPGPAGQSRPQGTPHHPTATATPRHRA